MSEIVRADVLTGFRELASQLGGDGDALLRSAGIDPDAPRSADSYISFRRFVMVLERAAVGLQCPDFGMRLAVRAGADILGPIAVAMRNAENARQAIKIAQRYMHFHNPSAILSVTRIDSGLDFVGVEMRLRRPPRAIQIVERGVAMIHGVLRLLCGPSYRPHEVRFTHAPLSSLSAYRDVFGETPTFEQRQNGILIARALLDAPRPEANEQIRRMAEHFLASVAPPAGDSDALAPRARLVIGQLMRTGSVTQAELASALGLHERTLQRRLRAEDTSFETLRDEARRDLAQTYLAQPGMPLAHIAEILGYAEASAFTRAARRWFGASPREVRKQLTASR